MLSRYDMFSSDSYSRQINLHIDWQKEPDYYYHSVGGMNPAKLAGILESGILSKSKAKKRGLRIDANGLQCNGTDYISTATCFGGCMTLDSGSFHFVINRKQITNLIRKNPEQDMPLERQIYKVIPRDCILGVRLEKNSFLDIEHPDIKLGVHVLSQTMATQQVKSLLNFMKKTFQHTPPEEDLLFLQTMLADFESKKVGKNLQARIEQVIKQHLKSCYQQKLSQEQITAFDILKYHDAEIPIFNVEGNLISAPATYSGPICIEKPKDSIQNSVIMPSFNS